MTASGSDEPQVGRRSVILGGATATLVGLTGCATVGRTGGETSGEGEADVTFETSAGDGTSDPSGGPTTAELDLREANVVGVEFERTNGTYRFSVTLHHDDDGEDGYADWWQVETTDGERLGRRDLLHAHGTQPFERSETIEIPDAVGCVVVRGHDQTHGYGGQAMLVNVASGATSTIRQGPDPRSFGPADCP